MPRSATRNEKTSKTVAALAAHLMATSDYNLDVWVNADPARARKAIRTLCGSLLTQAPDKKTSQVEKALLGQLGDDWGFDPRDGSTGNPERQHVPKQPVRRGGHRVAGKFAKRKPYYQKNQRHKVRVKAEGFDQTLTGPVELMKPTKKRARKPLKK